MATGSDGTTLPRRRPVGRDLRDAAPASRATRRGGLRPAFWTRGATLRAHGVAGLVLVLLVAGAGIGWAASSRDESVLVPAGGAPIAAVHAEGGAAAAVAGRASGPTASAVRDDASGGAGGLPSDAGAPPAVVTAQADTPQGGAAAPPKTGETSEPPAPAASSDPVDVELAPSALEKEAESMAEGAIAATASPPSAARWVVDRDRSSAGFTLTVEGTPVAGTIGDWRADILLDPDSLQTSSISAVMEMHTASVAGSAISEQQLRGEDGF
jgi:hypothetical protein